MWLRALEIYLTTALLRSPAFHRGVRVVHKKVHELKHGKDPLEMGGTNIDKPGNGIKKFFEHFVDELKDQIRGGPQARK